MPTEKPRVTITMTGDQLQQIDDFRFEHKMKNQTQAILYLVKTGLEELGYTDSEKEKAPLYSSEAMRLAKDYDGLDRWGKQALRQVADVEMARTVQSPTFFS